MDSVQNVDDISDRIRTVAKDLNLNKVYIFGSFARGQNNHKSDVDLLVSGTNFSSYSDIWALQDELEKVLGRAVDLFPIEDLQHFSITGQKSIINDRTLIYSNEI